MLCIVINQFFNIKSMADQQFQVIITNDDYSKLQHHEQQNKKLLAQNKNLSQQLITLHKKIKDLTRALYIRDSFIEYVANESDYAFGAILNLDIVSADITQSFYQDVVSHQQNGISSIELREAMELYISRNKRIFQRLNQIQDKFVELKNTISELESKKKDHNHSVPVPAPVIEKKKEFPSIKDIEHQNNMKQLEKQIEKVSRFRDQIQKLEVQRQQLRKQNDLLRNKNIKLNKDNQILSKKIETQGQKSYVIKLIVDEYYNELQTNLIKIGGLSKTEIGTVVSNEMKGIVQYIENLAKKASQ